jgi:hypothetical protein
MPAAWGWQTWRVSESRGDGGSVGVGARGPGARPKSLWGVMATARGRGQMEPSRGGGSDEKRCSLPHGIRTTPVTSAVVANSRDHPHHRAQGTPVGTVTTTHGLLTRRARKARAGPVPFACVAAQPPKPLTTASRRRPTASAALPLSGAPDARRSGSSRQGCASNGVQVLIPSIARFRRLAYPGHGKVTTHERLGWKSHGCHTVHAVSVGAIWVASKPAGLNIKK